MKDGKEKMPNEQIDETIRLYGEILANMDEGVSLVKVNDASVIYTNPKFEKMFGYEPSELIGKNISIVNAPTEKSPEETAEEIIGIIKREGIWRGEVNNIRKDGTTFWSSATVSLFHHKTHGKVLVGMLSDITDRKQVEEELKESEERFRGLIDADFDGIIIYEEDKIRDVNPSFVRMFGYKHEEVIDKSASEFVTLESYEKIKKNIQTRYEKLYEIKGVKKDGSTFDIEVIARNCRYHGSKARVVAMRDITYRKQAEQEQQKAYDELELRVGERTLELQEKNIALKVLLKQRGEDKNELEQNILSNIKSLIQPYIIKLKRNNSNLEDVAYLNIIESNLEDIISPFSQKLSSNYMKFSAKEIEIANLIKEGKKDKEIMEIMNIAFDTVKSHRRNIRKKLGIHGKGTNLRNKLLSM